MLALESFLEAAPAGGQAMLLEGDAGIGKTALWQEALRVAGERDFRVPVGQGLELYGVLKTKGVPARLVYYPDENHWVLKGQNAKHWYGEVLGWLARWLK